MLDMWKKLWCKLLFLLVYGGILILWATKSWPCIIRTVTKLPCPGCGLTRAYLALFRLNLQAAFFFHPMFWSIPLLVLFFLMDGQLFRSQWKNTLLNTVLLGGFAVCYAIRLVVYLNGFLTI